MKRLFTSLALIITFLSICYNAETNAQKSSNPVVYTTGVPSTCINGRIYVNSTTGTPYVYKTGVGCFASGSFSGGSVTSSITPNANNTLDLGTTLLTFRRGFFTNIQAQHFEGKIL